MSKIFFGEDWLYEPFHFRKGHNNYGKIYFSYCMIGCLSLLTKWVLIIAPVLWLIALLGIKKLTLRSWVASLLGLVTPYWIKLGLSYIG